jgi:hypothetical protein
VRGDDTFPFEYNLLYPSVRLSLKVGLGLRVLSPQTVALV